MTNSANASLNPPQDWLLGGEWTLKLFPAV